MEEALDHAARLQDFGSKMGIDATRKLREEGYSGRWPGEIKMDAATKSRVDEIWQHLKLARTNKSEETKGKQGILASSTPVISASKG